MQKPCAVQDKLRAVVLVVLNPARPLGACGTL
jgi:hypothetical protein